VPFIKVAEAISPGTRVITPVHLQPIVVN